MVVGLIDFSKEDLAVLGHDGRNALIDAVVSGKHEEVERIYRTLHPLTNEEYIRTASTNDMARCIATKLLELAKREYGIYDVVDYATIFEWLKEEHDANNT